MRLRQRRAVAKPRRRNEDKRRKHTRKEGRLRRERGRQRIPGRGRERGIARGILTVALLRTSPTHPPNLAWISSLRPCLLQAARAPPPSPPFAIRRFWVLIRPQAPLCCNSLPHITLRVGHVLVAALVTLTLASGTARLLPLACSCLLSEEQPQLRHQHKVV